MDAVKKIMSNSSKTSSDDSAMEGDAIGPALECITKNGHIDEEYPIKSKIPKLTDGVVPETRSELTLRADYTTHKFMTTLKKHWDADGAAEDYKHMPTEAQVFTNPYQICVLPELLKNRDMCKALVQEMIDKVHWSRKQMDLYQFYQSTDLSNMTDCTLLTQFLQMMRRTVCPWLERVTNLKLDYVSASCSMYTCGDFLLVHDDLLNDRQVAFVYYLSPWDSYEEWKEENGGCLEIFDSDEKCFPHFPVRRRIAPRNNQFVFFKVGSRSFHQVGEITTFDYPRLTINGWFHGATNEDLNTQNSIRPCTDLKFETPHNEDVDLPLLLNRLYMNSPIKESIQKRIEDHSEICLYEFLRCETYNNICHQLQTNKNLKWISRGPANTQNYEVLDLTNIEGPIALLFSIFSCKNMFELLRDYTDLDLAGPNASTPTYSLELQRWTHGNYTVMGDVSFSEGTALDLIYYLNVSAGVVEFSYIASELEDDQVASTSSSSLKHSSKLPSANAKNDKEQERKKDVKIISKDDEDEMEEADDIVQEEELEVEDEDDDEDNSVLLRIVPTNNALSIVYRCEGTTKFAKYVSHNTPLENGPVYVLSCSYRE